MLYLSARGKIFNKRCDIHFMKKSHITPTQHESYFSIDELFFSTTDKKGVITSGNSVFTRVSGYTFTELFGKPHNIIRHPDMPRAVFKLLWDYLDAGKLIAAYVKNLAKDGSYYWVVALAIPIDDGYLSIRFKPSSSFFALIPEVYRELCDIENEHEADDRGWKSGMDAATERLLAILASLGFGSYDAFMHAALREELKSRQTLLCELVSEEAFPPSRRKSREDGRSESSDQLLCIYDGYLAVGNHVDVLFARMDDYMSLNEKLQEKSVFILGLTNSIRLFALNASVEAVRLGGAGRTLSIIAAQLKEYSRTIASKVTLLNRRMLSLSDALKTVIFDLAVAKLQIDMATVFIQEVLYPLPGQGEGQDEGYATTEKIRVLGNVFSDTARRMLNLMDSIRGELGQVRNESQQLYGDIRTLRIVHLNGKMEAVSLGQRTRFPVILEDVAVQIERATSELNDLVWAVEESQSKLLEIPAIDSSITESIGKIHLAVEQLQEAA